jgi:hypothetical protein
LYRKIVEHHLHSDDERPRRRGPSRTR